MNEKYMVDSLYKSDEMFLLIINLYLCYLYFTRLLRGMFTWWFFLGEGGSIETILSMINSHLVTRKEMTFRNTRITSRNVC